MSDLQSQLQLRRLVFTARELSEATGWPSNVVEDYLATIENLFDLAQGADDANGVIDGITTQSQINDSIKTIREITDQLLQPVQARESQDIQVQQPNRVNRQTIKTLSTEELTVGKLNIDLVSNTNATPANTVYQIEVTDLDGVTVGYIPCYGSPW